MNNRNGAELHMPLARYFTWVGSVLLALLFLADAFLPKQPPAVERDVSLPGIRIHSDRKWPERVVFDTSAPVIRLAQAEIPEAARPPPVTADSPREARQAFAEQRGSDARPPAATAKKPEAKGQRQYRLARRQVARPLRFAERRPPFGWFGPTFW
jgi:hypothetical protein